MENGLSKIFYLQGQKIDVSDQAVFTLVNSGLHDEEGRKTNVSNPLTASQRRSGSFLSFMMTVHPDQADPNCNHNCMTCREFFKLPPDVYWIDASIDTQILKNPHYPLVHLAALENGINPDIGAIKKGRGETY